VPVIKMTKRVLDLIESPRSGREEFRDSSVSGLVLRVTSNDSRTWAYQYRYEGRNQRVTIGHFPVVDLQTARNRAGVLAGQVASGVNPADEKKQARMSRKSIRVNDLIEQFIERHEKPNLRNWRNTERNLRAHFGQRYGSRVADTIRMNQVSEITDRLIESGTPHAANHVRYVVQSMYRWGAGRRYVAESHELCSIPRPFKFNPFRDGRKRILEDDELRQLWCALDEMGRQKNRSWAAAATAYRILLLTGQRKEEISGSLWSWWKRVDPNGPLLEVPTTATKNHLRHYVPASKAVMNLIDSIEPGENGDHVFSSDGGRTHLSLGSKHKVWLDKKLNFRTPWVVHDLRRTAATGMRRIGVSSGVVEHILNHRQASVRDVYDLYQALPERREALDGWAAYVLKVVEL